MMSKYNTLLKLAAAFLLCSILEGCSLPTKPNEPYSGPYPSGFNELSNKNPLIAKELAKLPELQDGISEEEATSLDKYRLSQRLSKNLKSVKLVLVSY